MFSYYEKDQRIKIFRDGKLTPGEVPFPENKFVRKDEIFIGWHGSIGETKFRIIDVENKICEEVK
jgi:hypothetical protein